MEDIMGGSPVMTWYDSEILTTLTHLYKDDEMTLQSILPCLCSDFPVFFKIAELALEGNYERLVENGMWELPELIEKSECAYLLEDGLWYSNDNKAMEGVCPKCGHESSRTLFMDHSTVSMCEQCKVGWYIYFNLPSSPSFLGDGEDSDSYGRKALKDYESADDLYAASPLCKLGHIRAAIEMEKEKLIEQWEQQKVGPDDWDW